MHAIPCINLCKLEKAFRMSQVYLGQLVHMQVCFKGCGRLHEDVQVWCDRGKCASLYAGRRVWSVSTLICFRIKYSYLELIVPVWQQLSISQSIVPFIC